MINKGNPDLPVFAELPEGYTECNDRAYRLGTDEGPLTLDKCDKCGGWIGGAHIEVAVFEPLVNLTGKQGKDIYCGRCGHHFGFFGKRA